MIEFFLKVSYLLICLLLGNYVYCQTAIIDFENSVPTNIISEKGNLSISDEHYREGNQSLKWDWTSNDKLTITNLQITNQGWIFQYNLNTFHLWVYSEKKTNLAFKFRFYTPTGKEVYTFDYYPNFTGWRWIACSYRFNMKVVNPRGSETIDKIIIEAPNTGQGNIYFDRAQWLGSYTEVFKTELIDNVTDSNSSFHEAYKTTPLVDLITPNQSQINQMNTIRNSYKNPNLEYSKYSQALSFYNDLNIIENSEKKVKGKWVDLRNSTTIDYIENFIGYYKMFPSADLLNKIDLLLRHIYDLGYAENSVLPTQLIGSQAYTTRDYYNAIRYIYDYLPQETQNKINLTHNFSFYQGGVWNPTSTYFKDSDYVYLILPNLIFNTLSESNPEKRLQNARGLKYMLDKINIPSDGNKGWIKPDGTGFHHAAHYNAYLYSYENFIDVIQNLTDTEFQINQQGFDYLSEAVYNIYIMTNSKQYANSLSGRHPFSTGNIIDLNSLLKLINVSNKISPQKSEKLIRLYNRESNFSNNLYKDYGSDFFSNGFFQFNYSPLGIYRKDSWVASVRGMNNYFWGAEIYNNSNQFGRYQSYGALEILYNRLANSGYSINGWDWTKVPGTTTKKMPITDLIKYDGTTGQRFDVRSLSNYAAALRFDLIDDHLFKNRGKYGMYGFDFQEPSSNGIMITYDNNFKFKKSFYFFDDYIIHLGSSIVSGNQNYDVITNLFQGKLINQSDLITLNNNDYNNFGFQNSSIQKENWMLDTYKTGYYIKSDDILEFAKINQTSPRHNLQAGTTTDNFASAWINHGKNPQKSKYEVIIIPNTTKEKMNNFYNSEKPYKVIQQDDSAHIIKYDSKQIYAYSIFGQANFSNEGFLEYSDKPVLVMGKYTGNNLSISVVDPIIKMNNNIWENNTITLKIKGKFNKSTKGTIISSDENQTTIQINCSKGISEDIFLYKEESSENKQSIIYNTILKP